MEDRRREGGGGRGRNFLKNKRMHFSIMHTVHYVGKLNTIVTCHALMSISLRNEKSLLKVWYVIR